jgi:hypothetical protein
MVDRAGDESAIRITQEELGRLTGRHPRSARRVIKKLLDAGLLAYGAHGGRQANVYRFVGV